MRGRVFQGRRHHQQAREVELGDLLFPRHLLRALQAVGEGRGRSQEVARALPRPAARAQLSRLFLDRPGHQSRRGHAHDQARGRAARRRRLHRRLPRLGLLSARQHGGGGQAAGARRRTQARGSDHQRSPRRCLLEGWTRAGGALPVVARARSQARARGSRQDRGQAEIGASRRHRLGGGGRTEEARRRLRHMAAARAEKAPAKVNLTLRVLGRRADGYHDIESLVAFAGVGDALTFAPGGALALAVSGPTAAAAGDVADNLVLKAARALAERVEGLKLGRFKLSKRLPVAAGLGGGSADAAAALRLLARANRIAPDDLRLMQAARATGADVPVCLDPRARLMRGIGDILSAPLELPRLFALLVNPGVAVATKDVFAALNVPPAEHIAQVAPPAGPAELLAEITNGRNDLEASAIELEPAIADALAVLRKLPGCRLARMSGSGATCFGLFDSSRATAAAARTLRVGYPAWWVRATGLGG